MPEMPIYPPISTIRIDVYWEDKVSKGGNSFFTLQEFANYLRDNPKIAQALGHVPKQKK